MKKIVIVLAVVIVGLLLFFGGKQVLNLSYDDNPVDSTEIVVDTVGVDSAAVVSPDSAK